MDWSNILKQPTHWEENWVEPVVHYNTISCLICRGIREHRTYRRDWEHFICRECRNRMHRNGTFVIEALHNIVQRLSEKRYSEEEFFIRLDHILKTLKVENLVINYKINFGPLIGDGCATFCTSVAHWFYVEILNPMIKTDVMRTYSFSVEKCCVVEPLPEQIKQEYLPKEHFKWEDYDGQQI